MEASLMVEQARPSSRSKRNSSRNTNNFQHADEANQISLTSSTEFGILCPFNEGIYIGMICNKLPEGAGLYRTQAGFLYVGEFSQGAFNGYGETKKSSCVYIGQFLRGEMSGIGSIKTKKSAAISHFVHDKKHGVTRICNNDKSHTMDGYYKDGETRGYCIVGDPNKRVILSGMFEKTNLNGIGREETAELLFIGNYSNNKKCGIGKIIYFDRDSTYAGSWKDDLRDGYGQLYDSTRNESYEGTFSDGFKHGIGRFSNHVARVTYIGKFEKEHYEGQGKLDFSHSFYLGNFHKSLRSGLGYERSKQDAIYFGYWRNDKREGLGLDRNLQREYLGEWSRDLPHGKGLVTIDGCTKAALYEDGKLVDLLPDGMIYELQQEFGLLNFEKFIHSMSKYIEDLHQHIETTSQEVGLRIDQIERQLESLDSKLKSDIKLLDDQNKQVQEDCIRMAKVLETVFESKNLDLKHLATISYAELVAQVKALQAEKNELGSSRDARLNLHVANPILNKSMKFDPIDHLEDSARVTPSLTLNYKENPGRFDEFKHSSSPGRKREPLKNVETTTMSITELNPGLRGLFQSKSSNKNYDSLVNSRLVPTSSQLKRSSKSKNQTYMNSRKSRILESKLSSDDELEFISNNKGASAKLNLKKKLNPSSNKRKLSKYEENERARKIEAERQELHARRRNEYYPQNEERSLKDYIRKNYSLGKSPNVETKRTLNKNSVTDAIIPITQQDLEKKDKNCPIDFMSVPKPKIQSSILVSRLTLSSPEAAVQIDKAKTNPTTQVTDGSDSAGSPEIGSVTFASIKRPVNIQGPEEPPIITGKEFAKESKPNLNSDVCHTVHDKPSLHVCSQDSGIKPHESFEELIQHRENELNRFAKVNDILIPPELISEVIVKQPSSPEIDTKKILNDLAKVTNKRGKEAIAVEEVERNQKAELETLRKKEEAGLKAQRKKEEEILIQNTKDMNRFKKSVLKIKDEALKSNTLLNLGVKIVNRIMEQFNEDGEEYEKPLNTETFSEPSEPDLPSFESELEMLADPAEFHLLVKGYQTFKKLEADEKGNLICLGGFKSLLFIKVNSETKEYKTVKYYPSRVGM